MLLVSSAVVVTIAKWKASNAYVTINALVFVHVCVHARMNVCGVMGNTNNSNGRACTNEK